MMVSIWLRTAYCTPKVQSTAEMVYLRGLKVQQIFDRKLQTGQRRRQLTGSRQPIVGYVGTWQILHLSLSINPGYLGREK